MTWVVPAEKLTWGRPNPPVPARRPEVRRGILRAPAPARNLRRCRGGPPRWMMQPRVAQDAGVQVRDGQDGVDVPGCDRQYEPGEKARVRPRATATRWRTAGPKPSCCAALSSRRRPRSAAPATCSAVRPRKGSGRGCRDQTRTQPPPVTPGLSNHPQPGVVRPYPMPHPRSRPLRGRPSELSQARREMTYSHRSCAEEGLVDGCTLPAFMS